MMKDQVLAKLGLQTRTTARDLLLPTLGIFGAGIVVGTGVALLLTPKSGAELRGEIAREASMLKNRLTPRGYGPESSDLEEVTREELYQRARAMDIEGRSNMSKSELFEAVQAS